MSLNFRFRVPIQQFRYLNQFCLFVFYLKEIESRNWYAVSNRSKICISDFHNINSSRLVLKEDKRLVVCLFNTSISCTCIVVFNPEYMIYCSFGKFYNTSKCMFIIWYMVKGIACWRSLCLSYFQFNVIPPSRFLLWKITLWQFTNTSKLKAITA